jgi:adenylate cyclase
MTGQSHVQPIGQQPSLSLLGGHRLSGSDLNVVSVAKKEIALLAYLACAQPPSHSRERLTTLLWGSRFGKQARQSLRHAVMSLRRTLGFDPFLAKAHAIALRPHTVECDVGNFETFARSNCDASLDKAIELYKGPLLDGLLIEEEAWTEWLTCERMRLEELALEVILRRGDQLLAANQPVHALGLALRAIAINPFREDATTLAMRASVIAGRKSEALRRYNDYRVLLAKELNTKPDDPTTRLYELIRGGEYPPEMHAHATGTPESLYVSTSAGRTTETTSNANSSAGANGARAIPQAEPLAVAPSVVKFPGPPHRRHGSSPISINASHSRSAKWIDHASGGAAVIPDRGPCDENRLSTAVLAPAGLDRAGKSSAVGDILIDDDAASVGAQREHELSAKTSNARPFRPDGDPVAHSVSAARASALPTIAVIPFCTPASGPAGRTIGHLLADEIIASICRSPDLAAISRFSTQALNNLDFDASDIATRLRADYALWGTPYSSGDSIRIGLELVRVSSCEIIWSDTVEFSEQSVQRSCQVIVGAVVAAMRASLLTHEVVRFQSQPLEELENYSLLLSAITLMHRTSKTGFDQACRLLEILSQRLPRHPLPYAWLAQLHLFQATLGRSDDLVLDQQKALDLAQRATDLDPHCSIALAAEAWVNLHVRKRFDIASDRLARALQSNMSESTAWLLKGSMHAFRGEGDEAISASEHARKLSPLDPRRSYYDCLAASAYLSAERIDEAIMLAKESLRVNRLHASTWRALIVGLVLKGRLDEARLAVPELLRLDPNLTVGGYLKRHPASDYPIGSTWAEALRKAGVPN